MGKSERKVGSANLEEERGGRGGGGGEGRRRQAHEVVVLKLIVYTMPSWKNLQMPAQQSSQWRGQRMICQGPNDQDRGVPWLNSA